MYHKTATERFHEPHRAFWKGVQSPFFTQMLNIFNMTRNIPLPRAFAVGSAMPSSGARKPDVGIEPTSPRNCPSFRRCYLVKQGMKIPGKSVEVFVSSVIVGDGIEPSSSVIHCPTHFPSKKRVFKLTLLSSMVRRFHDQSRRSNQIRYGSIHRTT